MSGKALEWVWSLQLPAVQKAVLYALAGYHSQKNPNPYPSKHTIADRAGVSRATVLRTIDQLENAGFIAVDRSSGRSSNRYMLNIEPAHSATVETSQPAHTDMVETAKPAHTDTVETAKPAHSERQPAHSETPTGSQRDPNKDINKVRTRSIAQMRNGANAQRQGIRFADFWSVYPKKRDKRKAEQLWKSRKLDSKADALIADVKTRLAQDRQWKDPQYIPYPTTYLRNQRWQDDIEPAKRNGAGNGQQPRTEAGWIAWGQAKDLPAKPGEETRQYLQRLRNEYQRANP